MANPNPPGHRWKPGQSGNPSGRRPGTPVGVKLRRAIEKDQPEIIKAMVEKAKAGDVPAAKLLLDRTLAPLRPAQAPVTLPPGGDLAASGFVVLEAMKAGQLPPDTASAILQGLGALAKVIETTELIARVEALEQNRAPEPAEPPQSDSR